MHSTTLKKAVLRLHPTEWLSGFVDPAELRDSQPLTCLLPEGQARPVLRSALQAAYFVADFAAPAELTALPPRGAPALPGLRVRVRTRGGCLLEGILATDLLQLAQGVDLTPLHAAAAWQRLFVPATALAQLLPVAVVRAPRRRRPAAPAGEQFPLFHPGPSAPEKEVH